jgi:hypothetical protein
MDISRYISNIIHANKRINLLTKRLNKLHQENADIVKQNDILFKKIEELNNKILDNSIKKNQNQQNDFSARVTQPSKNMPSSGSPLKKIGDNFVKAESMNDCINCLTGKENTTYLCPFCSQDKPTYLCGKHYQGHISKYHSDKSVQFTEDGSIIYKSK